MRRRTARTRARRWPARRRRSAPLAERAWDEQQARRHAASRRSRAANCDVDADLPPAARPRARVPRPSDWILSGLVLGEAALVAYAKLRSRFATKAAASEPNVETPPRPSPVVKTLSGCASRVARSGRMSRPWSNRLFRFLFKYPPLVFQQGDFTWGLSRPLLLAVGRRRRRASLALLTYRGVDGDRAACAIASCSIGLRLAAARACCSSACSGRR